METTQSGQARSAAGTRGKKDVRLALGGLASKFVYAPLTLAATMLLTRVLDVDEFGSYSYLISVILLATLPAKVGLPNVLVRFLTQYRVDGDVEQIAGMLQWGRRWMVGLGLGGAVVVAVWFLADDALTAGLIPALLVVPLFADNAARSGMLRGLGRPLLGLIPDEVVRPLVHVVGIAVVAGGATVWGWDLDLGTAVWLYAGAFAVAWAVGAVWLRRESEPYSGGGRLETGAWIAAALPMTLMNGMSLINQQADIVILRQYAPPSDIAFYKVALSSVVLISFGLQAVNAVLAPRYGEAYHEGNLRELTKLARLALAGGLAVAFPVGAVCLVVPDQILSLLFGASYGQAASILAVLACGQLANAVGGPCGMLMNMSGHERAASQVVIVSSLLNIVANLAVAPVYGAVGCAVVTSLTFVLWNVWMYLLVRSKVGVAYLF